MRIDRKVETLHDTLYNVRYLPTCYTQDCLTRPSSVLAASERVKGLDGVCEQVERAATGRLASLSRGCGGPPGGERVTNRKQYAR